MAVRYHVQFAIDDSTQTYRIRSELEKKTFLLDERGELSEFEFTKKNPPYIGSIVVVSTTNEEKANMAYNTLRTIKGIRALDIITSKLEK